MESITITVGIPPRILSPNAKGQSWRRKIRPRQETRYHAHMAALAALDGRDAPKWEKAELRIRWFGRTRNVLRMDRDNAIATLKAAFDGLTDAGIWHDDHAASIAADQPTFAVDRDEPRVELEVRRRVA